MAYPQPALPKLGELDVDPSRGLTSSQAADRLARYGPNLLTPEQRGLRWRRLLQPFADPMVIILLVAGVIFFALGERRDAIIILVAIAPVILVDLILDIRAERTLERLRELTAPRATVRRDGREVRIPSEGIVPGDVLLVEEGDVILADGVVESESNFQVDESALTGEALPVPKRGVGWPPPPSALENRDSMVYAGTTVVAGRATIVVTATGSRTQYGEIGALVAGIGTQLTPIQRTIGELVRNLGIVAIVASLGVAGLELARGAGAVDALLAGVSLAIAAIPEEFSIVFAIYMTLGAWRMARHNALIRRLAGVETLGSTTVICTDKTGTLTQGRLAIEGLYADGELRIGPCRASEPALQRLLEDALLASEPHPFDPLDQAIAERSKEAGVDPSQVFSRWTMAQDYPFDPERKYVTHIWRSPRGELRVCSKGSIEGLLELSLASQEEREAYLRVNSELSNRGMRVIAVAEKTTRRATGNRWADESGLNLVGLIGFADPLRENVRRAVTDCQTAGIRVIMITGDHPLTAHAVAESVGLYHEDEGIMTGPEVAQLDDRGLQQALARVTIFARTLPAQKFRIVRGLQARGQIVAMTGDGINDAPALRTANIGVAMGRRGTQVARAAATMVLLDDNFGTIVEAIRQGRHIFDSLRRAFLYIIIFHVPIVLAAVLVPLVGAPLLLLPIHLVWLELILHPTAALVFESDPPEPNIMRRPPRNPREPLLSTQMSILVATQGTAMLLGTLGIYLGLIAAGTGIEQARGAAIAALVLAQTILVLQTRSPDQPFWRRGVLGNRVLIPAILVTLASLGLMIYLSPLASAAQFVPPSAEQWGLAVAVALATTLPFELPKLRRR